MNKIKKTKKAPAPEKEAEDNVVQVFKSEIERFVRFGRELKITPKANATVSKPGFRIEFFVPTVSVLVGIGNDHVANLVMDLEAWKAFVEGEKLHITTTEEFNKQFINELKDRK